MSYCPFCGEKIEDGLKCKKCGYTPSAGNKTEKYEIPTWLKLVMVAAMFFVSGGSIIGAIAGAVLSSSKDDKYKFYGKWILKAALIMLAVKAVIAVIAFILIVVLGVLNAAVIMSVPEFASAGVWMI